MGNIYRSIELFRLNEIEDVIDFKKAGNSKQNFSLVIASNFFNYLPSSGRAFKLSHEKEKDVIRNG